MSNYLGCLNGPGSSWLNLGCANRDAVADVDLMDAAQLQLEFTGALP